MTTNVGGLPKNCVQLKVNANEIFTDQDDKKTYIS